MEASSIYGTLLEMLEPDSRKLPAALSQFGAFSKLPSRT